MGTIPPGNAGAGAFSTPGVDNKASNTPSPILTTNPAVSFKLQQVEPPSPLYINQADRLMVSVLNDDPNVSRMELHYRLLRASDGQLSLGVIDFPVTSDRTANRQMFDMTEGYLLGVKLVGNGGTTRGRCYLSLDVARGQIATRSLYYQLIADYSSRGHDPTWPNASYIHSIDGPGWIHRIAGTTPCRRCGH